MSTEKQSTEQPTKVITGMVRFSYLTVFKPKASEVGGEEKFSVQLIIPKTDKDTIGDFARAIRAAKEAGADKLKGAGTLKMPLRDGDKEFPDREELKGCYFVNATAKQKPGVIDRKKLPITDTTQIKSGDYGRAAVNFYAFAGKAKGIACGLNNIQKLKDGPALGGRAEAIDDFKDDFAFDEDADLLAGTDGDLNDLMNG